MTRYLNLPWKSGGSTPAGVDCRGLALLWYRENHPAWPATEPAKIPAPRADSDLILAPSRALMGRARGDLLLFAHRGRVVHCAIALDAVAILHITRGGVSRIEPGLTLVQRLGYTYAGRVPFDRVPDLLTQLGNPALGDFVTPTVAFILAAGLSAAAAFLTPKPKPGRFADQAGRYGFDNLATAHNPELPLPDILGAVAVAGNSPYQSRRDETQDPGDPRAQKLNKIIILSAGDIEAITHNGAEIKINGRPLSDTYWHPSGYKQTPAQTKAEAVTGMIGGEAGRPSYTLYDGAPALDTSVDVRAQYDRNFPLYGFHGSAYLVLRVINALIHDGINVTLTVRGRKCRSFDSNGFTSATSTSEAVGTGDGTTTRFKLDYDDVKTLTTLTVDGVTYTAADADNQTGNVYHLNAKDGIIEFAVAPASTLAIVATYDYYPRTWTQNPARHLIYLLTQSRRGKGLPEDKIDWPAAAALADQCDEEILWEDPDGWTIEPRHTANYVLDVRKPIQDHLRAVLDACYAAAYFSGGKLVLKTRHTADSVFSFTASNILRDSFTAELVDRSQLANRVIAAYRGEETYNAETSVRRDDPLDQAERAPQVGNDGVIEENLKLIAVDRPTHAARLAETVLRENVMRENVNWLVKFTTTIKGLPLEPLDIVDVTHPAQPDWAGKLLRIEAIEHDQDDRLEITATEHLPAAYI